MGYIYCKKSNIFIDIIYKIVVLFSKKLSYNLVIYVLFLY